MNSFTPHITVATVVEDNGRFLLVHEKEHEQEQLCLNQPAGHVQAGETLPQAAFRETLEKTGWQVEITHYLGLYIYQATLGGAVYYRHCFSATPISHDRCLRLSARIEAVLWLAPDELHARRQEHSSPMVTRGLDDYLAGRRLPLDTIRQHAWPLQQG